MDNEKNNALKLIWTSRFDAVIICSTFLLTALMIYFTMKPVAEFVMQYWPNTNALDFWLRSQQRYYDGIFNKGSHTDILVLLAGLASFAIELMKRVVVPMLSIAFILLPSALIILAILGGPQILVLSVWRYMRNTPKP